MVKKVIDIFDIPVNKAVPAALRAECNVHKSITYKTFHLLNGLGYDGVMPAIMNLIIKTFIEYKKIGTTGKIDIEEFEMFVKDIANDSKHDAYDFLFADIHKWSFEIWKAVLYSEDYTIPREIANKIVARVNYSSNDISSMSVDIDTNQRMQKQFDDWTMEWQYGKKNTDLKVKILFIDLFMTSKSEDKLHINPAIHTFSTDKLQLDHMEANNPEPSMIEKMFKPENPYEKRENVVNGLGNFMILDSVDNNNKKNKPLMDAMVFYDKMCPRHWLIEEVKELLNDDNFSKCVNIAGKQYRVPIDNFFAERRTRLQKYFKTILARGLNDKEMPLS